jgi:pectin methylesterase-like acyl-CoA thioesterase/lysophospholipase L1-like esterase
MTQTFSPWGAVMAALLIATSAIPISAKTLVVAADGSGDFTRVQAAVDAATANNAERVVIHIKPGTYKERIRVSRDKPRLTFEGEDAKTTILTFDFSANKVVAPATQPVGTSGSYSTLIEADEFLARNITFENTAGEVGQAVALRTTGQRQAFHDCRMLGWQDTLYVHQGDTHFVNCYIEGRVDFIFGRATAVFEKCHIHSKNGGYVTAAATAKDDPFGFVFLDCKLTGEGAKAFLGRPWRDDAAVAFIRCELGDHIRPEGWDNWRNPAREKTARFVEYQCTGPGANRKQRVPWSRELTDAEAAKYTAANVLAARLARPIRIVLVGDSTVTDKQGWGPGFKALLADGVECVNVARGGRSSKSFRSEGLWEPVLAERADYVLIQFGHNDEPGKGLDRETDAGTEFRANMKRYLEEARAKGMKPILVTSLTRRQFGPDGKINSSLIPYVQAVKDVAADTKCPLIDLHARSIELCEMLGPDGCKSFSPPKGEDIDRTHLNEEGAKLFGAIVAEELRKAVPELAPYVNAPPPRDEKRK